MKKTYTLDNKDIRLIIAKYLEIRLEDVIPNKYTYSVSGIDEPKLIDKLSE